MQAGSGLYSALLLSGFLGSLGHCLGMCGPLVTMAGLQARARSLPLLPSLLLYHMARVAMYAGLGAAVGTIGSFIDLAAQLSHLSGGLSLVFGMSVSVVSLSYLGALSLPQIDVFGSRLSRSMGEVLKRGGLRGMALFGALTGLLPCCLVYGALLLAASTAAALPGALAMAAFGLGTMPALLAVGLGVGMLGPRTRQLLSRATGAFFLLVGLQLALRGLAELHLAPHLQIGNLALW